VQGENKDETGEERRGEERKEREWRDPQCVSLNSL